MAWTWHYTDDAGQPLNVPTTQSQAFPTQSDAETWIGESWRDLLDSGIDSVVLREDDHVVYGPMGLRPLE